MGEVTLLHVVTFAGGIRCWKKAQTRLGKELRRLDSEIRHWSFSQESACEVMKKQGLDLASFSKTHPRGFGLWSWKPFIIQEVLLNAQDGDHIIYMDSGSTANTSVGSRIRLQSYRQIIDRNSLLAFQLQHSDYLYSKYAVVNNYSMTREDIRSGQICATIVGVKNDRLGTGLVREWCSGVSREKFSLLKDPTPNDQQIEGFIAHRHDQAIWSAIIKKAGLAPIPDETYFGSNWKSSGRDYPFWATRKCSSSRWIVGENLIGRMYLGLAKQISKSMVTRND